MIFIATEYFVVVLNDVYCIVVKTAQLSLLIAQRF